MAITTAFATDGLHGVSATEIARRAGVAKPTLYAHGRSKDSLFLACIEAEIERLLDRLYDAEVRTRELATKQRIAGIALAVIEHGREHPAAAQLLHATARHRSSSVAAQVDAALGRLPSRIAAALPREIGPVRAHLIATALLGAASALALARTPDARVAAQLLAEAFAAVLEPAESERPGDHVRSVGVY